MILEISQHALSPDNQALKRPLSFEEKLFCSFLSRLFLATNLQMPIARVVGGLGGYFVGFVVLI